MRIEIAPTSHSSRRVLLSPACRHPAANGWSLVEAMLVLTVLAILASIGVQVVHSLTAATQNSKLSTDVGTLNRAVTMYLASGGDLSGVSTASDVLARMKTTSSAERVKTQINPLTRQMVDSRLSVRLQTASDAASGRPRAYWNAADQRFDVVTSGAAGGVQAFILDDNAAPAQPQVESRRSGSMEFAKDSGWIWDYKENWDTGAGPSVIPTAVTTRPLAPPTRVPATLRPSDLGAPVFSIVGGVYPATDFDLSLRLSNPNPGGSSHITYSLGDGAWHSYRDSLSVAPGTQVIAKAVSNDASRWNDSPVRRETYSTTLINLAAPTITLSEVAFTDNVSMIQINITDNNASGLADIYFDIKPRNGGGYQPVQLWARYGGSLAASVNDFPEGFDVIAYAKAINPDTHEHSDNAQASTSATFFDKPLSGDILFVIDASSSMNNRFGGGTRYQAAIQETVSAIWALDPSQRFSVAMFDAGVHWTDGSYELKEANQANKISITFQIQSVNNDSGTNYQAALGLALQYDPMPGTVVFLTDGRPDGTPYASELAQLVSRGIKVEVFGIELDASATAKVQAIAAATGGSVTEVSAN